VAEIFYENARLQQNTVNARFPVRRKSEKPFETGAARRAAQFD
jgi:hypothetical protein